MTAMQSAIQHVINDVETNYYHQIELGEDIILDSDYVKRICRTFESFLVDIEACQISFILQFCRKNNYHDYKVNHDFTILPSSIEFFKEVPQKGIFQMDEDLQR